LRFDAVVYACRYGTVKESEADQMLRNKALIIDEIESTLTDAVVQDLNSRWGHKQHRSCSTSTAMCTAALMVIVRGVCASSVST
jgi:hypothetical protein